MTGELQAPAVPPAAYDEGYYRQTCGGATDWSPDGPIGGIYAHVLHRRLDLQPGATLVDIGCGRGELVALAAAAGISAVGIEYSPDAIALAERTVAGHHAQDRAQVLHADARALPLPAESADAVTMLDVVEHLTAQELPVALAEARRVLKPGGALLAHTFPNRLVYDVTYRVQRSLTPRRRRTWPEDPRTPAERLMHVGEQTPPALTKAVRAAGFTEVQAEWGDWVYTEFIPDPGPRRTVRALSRIPGLRRLAIANFFVRAIAPPRR